MAFMLAVSAILIGYYQFYLSRPILEYSSLTDRLISSAGNKDMHMRINGKKYTNVYKSVITLTNSDEAALSEGDASPENHAPIRIPIPPQVKVLYYNIDSENTSPDVAAKLEKNDNDILIKFSYLNPGNSLAVDLFSEQDYDQYKITGSEN